MPPKSSQVVLVQHGDGFLNGLVPDFARMLDDQLSASSALGSILSCDHFEQIPLNLGFD